MSQIKPCLSLTLSEELENSCAPYLVFSRSEWENLHADMPLSLKTKDITALRSLNDPIHLQEVEKIYLPLSRLLKEHYESSRELFFKRQNFLKKEIVKTPFIIGVAGSVAVGKSTTARLLKALIENWSFRPKVNLVTTDGFLYPNAKLTALKKMRRKGFPDSYDLLAMIEFLAKVKMGQRNVKAPCYSHFIYDVIADDFQIVDQPDILIFEGLNVLQIHDRKKKQPAVYVSDFFDFSLYIDADKDHIQNWYLERFKSLRLTAFQDKASFFHRYALMKEEEALNIAQDLWHNINLKNLNENILPTKLRANLILHKDIRHFADVLAVRRV